MEHIKHIQVDIAKASPGSSADARFIVSATSPDRVGDRLSAKVLKAVADKAKRMVALWMHKQDQPVGYWQNYSYVRGKLAADLFLASTRLAAMIKTLLDDDVPLAASIGFRVLEGVENKNGGYDFEDIDLLEISIVSTPAHPKAVRVKAIEIAKAHGIDPKILSLDGSGPHRAPTVNKASAKDQTVAQTAHQTEGTKPMKTSDKILDLGQQLAAIDDQKLELAEKMEADDFDGDLDEITKQVERLDEDRQAVEAELNLCKSLEDAKRKRMDQVGAQQQQQAPASPAVVSSAAVTKGDTTNLLGKRAMIDALAFTRRKSINEIVEEEFPTDRSINAVVKTATGVADSTTAGFAKELVGQATMEFLETATNQTLFGQLRQLGRSVRFNNTDAAKLTYLDRSKPTRSAFVGENGVIPTGSVAFGEKRLAKQKMGVIIPLSKELLSNSPYDVVGQFESALSDFMADQLDEHLLDGAAAVAGVRPASIINGVAGHTTAGATAANVVTDLNLIWKTLEDAKNTGTPVLAMSSSRHRGLLTTSWPSGGFSYRDDLNAGRLLGAQVATSDNIDPSKIQLLLLDASKFGWAYGMPEFETSDQATIVLANADATAPTMAVDAAGAKGTADEVIPDGGINVRNAAAFEGAAGVGDFKAVSLWQINAVGVKAIMPIAFDMLVPNAIDYIKP